MGPVFVYIDNTLKNHYNLPGMRVLEFSIFDDEFNDKKIKSENTVYYISTHDNETLKQWIKSLETESKIKIKQLI